MDQVTASSTTITTVEDVPLGLSCSWKMMEELRQKNTSTVRMMERSVIRNQVMFQMAGL
jgi:hypothetical protein